MTGDGGLLDELIRLCAAAGAVPEVAADVGAARRAWAGSALLIVGGDRAAELCALEPPRRDGVVLVAADSSDTGIWAPAVALGAEHVLVLPRQQDALLDLLAACVDGGLRAAWTASVVSGAGGAGASTFAAGLAMTAADRGLRTLLVDADPLGGGIDLLLGSEDATGSRWPDLAGARGRLATSSLREVLPVVGSVSVLSWDRGMPQRAPVESMRSVLSAGQRGNDVVVVDCPRWPDPAAEEALTRSNLVLLLVPAEVRAVAAAAQVLSALRPVTAQIGLVVRGPGSSGLDGSRVADSLQLPLVAQMRTERGLAAALEEGLGPMRRKRGQLATCCAVVLDSVAGLDGAAA